ncbi:glycerophosphodiester phosphodiesterase GDPD3-like [Nicotiana tabacum]|uniref:glycerophosphodiester phosphodiesterase n=1 Tax=Nicotiana tabacum TaxID=4097 RepID=A0A1S4BU18_TOBAC|nr:PREDICTED: glycerophosphodiester phosphodiesterase GDPD3-like [Nicotiana tabacum]
MASFMRSCDRRSKAIKENTLCSFNEAAKFNVDFIEFDVQVTRDGHPVIFHDIFILTQEEGKLIEKRVTAGYSIRFYFNCCEATGIRTLSPWVKA